MNKPNTNYTLPNEDRLRQYLMDGGNKMLRASFVHLDMPTRKQYMHQLTNRYTIPMLHQIEKSINDQNLGRYIEKNLVNLDGENQNDRANIMQEWLEAQE